MHTVIYLQLQNGECIVLSIGSNSFGIILTLMLSWLFYYFVRARHHKSCDHVTIGHVNIFKLHKDKDLNAGLMPYICLTA
jgi:hypothetical protein